MNLFYLNFVEFITVIIVKAFPKTPKANRGYIMIAETIASALLNGRTKNTLK